jgi:hypothetical protein
LSTDVYKGKETPRTTQGKKEERENIREGQEQMKRRNLGGRMACRFYLPLMNYM